MIEVHVMGGFGSGRWFMHNSKSTTDASNRLDIRYMRKQNSLTPGASGTLSWDIDGTPNGSIGYTVCEDMIILNYDYTAISYDKPVPITQNIFFDTTSCNYGGERKWFLCPDCGKRRDVLFFHGMNFTCRTCADLAYQCQREQAFERNSRQAMKIRQKLKTKDFNPDNLSDIVIFKPKGMHQTTFNRLRMEQLKRMHLSTQQLFAKLEKGKRVIKMMSRQ